MISTIKIIEMGPGANNDLKSTRRGKLGSEAALQVSRRQATVTSYYESLLGTLYIRRTTTAMSLNEGYESSKSNPLIQSKSSWSFFPTFLSRCVELQFHNSYSSIFPSLRTHQVIDSTDPIINICYEGTGTALQAYFDNNRDRITPFVVEGSGRSLLYVSNNANERRKLSNNKRAVCSTRAEL
jgi:hypothetical protein